MTKSEHRQRQLTTDLPIIAVIGGGCAVPAANVTIAHDLPPISAPLATYVEEVPTTIQKHEEIPRSEIMKSKDAATFKRAAKGRGPRRPLRQDRHPGGRRGTALSERRQEPGLCAGRPARRGMALARCQPPDPVCATQDRMVRTRPAERAGRVRSLLCAPAHIKTSCKTRRTWAITDSIRSGDRGRLVIGACAREGPCSRSMCPMARALNARDAASDRLRFLKTASGSTSSPPRWPKTSCSNAISASRCRPAKRCRRSRSPAVSMSRTARAT